MSEEYEIEVIPVVVAAEPIELYKILKIENLVTSGSEAKQLIAEGYVFVNGEVETRKRKKIMYGDIIGFNGEAFQVLSQAEMQEYIDSGEYEMAPEPEYVEAEQGEYITEAQYAEEQAFVAVNVEVDGSAEVVTKNKAPAQRAEPAFVSADKPKKQKKDKQTKAANKKKKGRAAPFSF